MVLGARTDVRAREATARQFGVDVATTPTARLEARGRRSSFSVGYAPVLNLRDLQGATALDVLHVGDAGFAWKAREFSLSLGESASYGATSFAGLTPTAANPNLPLPSTQTLTTTSTLQLGSSRTGGFLRWTWPRASFALAPSFAVAGGLDDASRAAVPVLRTPRLDVAASVRASRVDQLFTEGSAQVNDSGGRACDPVTGGPVLPGGVAGWCSPSSEIVEGREVWRHALSRHSELAVGAGAAVMRTQVDTGAVAKVSVLPTGVVTLTSDLALGRKSRPRVELAARVTPLVDLRYQLTEPRLDASAAWVGTVGRTTFSARATLLRSLPPTSLDLLAVGLSAELMRALDRRFDVGLGARGVWQRDANAGQGTLVTVLLSFVWHEPRVRL